MLIPLFQLDYGWWVLSACANDGTYSFLMYGTGAECKVLTEDMDTISVCCAVVEIVQVLVR
jgi:hypothetical protein